MRNVLFFSIIAKKKLNIDEESGSLGFGGVFFPTHVVDLLSNLNETIRRFPRPVRYVCHRDGGERRRQVGGLGKEKLYGF